MSASTKESLQDQLDRITQNTRALVQPERLAISEKATEDLFNTGIEDPILKAGAQPPAFPLKPPLPTHNTAPEGTPPPPPPPRLPQPPPKPHHLTRPPRQLPRPPPPRRRPRRPRPAKLRP